MKVETPERRIRPKTNNVLLDSKYNPFDVRTSYDTALLVTEMAGEVRESADLSLIS